jgi:hypothetical protein
MLHPRAKFFLYILLLASGGRVVAQTGSSSNPTNGRENNPYSKFGIGELQNGNSAALRGMGSASTAFENPYEMNTENPASYSFLDRTTFELGASATTRNVAGSGYTYNTGTATLSYFSLGLPINKHAGVCLGFKPISHVYYNMVDTIPSGTITSPIGQVVRSYTGDGGLNYAYLGGAWRHKGLSLGLNVGYMFGALNNITSTIPIDQSSVNRAFTAEYANYNQIGGIYWKAGLLYERKFDSVYTIRIGGTFALAQNLTQRLNGFQISGFNYSDTVVSDTVSNPGEQHGKLKMPMSYSIGVMLAKSDKWGVALDYAATKWSDYSSSLDPTLNTGIASMSSKVSLGGELTPDANNLRNFFSRVTYRFGMYYGSDYVKISGTQLPVFGLTAGASLPVRRSLSHLHLGVDVGRLGTNNNNLIQETYVKFTLGISFNDRWFVKRRYD